MAAAGHRKRNGMPGLMSLPLLVVLTIAFGLLADRHGGDWGQALVSLWTWAFFALLLYRSEGSRARLLACLCIATAGEVVLSLVWGLYDYRLGNLPLFVPPGHVLLYWLGLQLAERLPEAAVKVLPWLALGAVSVQAVAGIDGLGPLLIAVFLVCVRWGPAPRLYVTMFLLALMMELWGTWLGNWTWRGQVPGLGWPLANPPLAAGAFYCVLDLLSDSVRGRRACPAD